MAITFQLDKVEIPPWRGISCWPTMMATRSTFYIIGLDHIGEEMAIRPPDS